MDSYGPLKGLIFIHMMTIYSPINTKERGKIDMQSGDTIRVWQKIQEKDKTRLQAFEGLLIARKHGAEAGATFTVRKIASGVGVEKIFPLYSPIIDKIEIVRRAKTRRSKLYYIREKSTKEIRRKMRGLASFIPTSYQEEEVKKDAVEENIEISSEEVKKETPREEGKVVEEKDVKPEKEEEK